jgi:hypothetical protein
MPKQGLLVHEEADALLFLALKGKAATFPAILARNAGAHPIRGALACIFSRHETVERISARMFAAADILVRCSGLWLHRLSGVKDRGAHQSQASEFSKVF